MKKLLLVLLVISLTTSSFAKINNAGITTVKKIKTAEMVTCLKIYNNVAVVLTDNESNEIQIVGEKTNVETILVKINNGEITISSNSEDFIKAQVVVYVPSKTLAGVYIHGSSIVSSEGILSNELLDITINGEGRSNIQTSGNLNVNTIGDFPIEPASN